MEDETALQFSMLQSSTASSATNNQSLQLVPDPKKKKLSAAVMAALILAVFCMLLALVHSSLNHVFSVMRGNVCETEACQRWSRLMLTTIPDVAIKDTSLKNRSKPCDDFYDYVCGREFEAPSQTIHGKTFQSVHDNLITSVRKQLNEEWLNHPVAAINQTAVDKVAVVYQTCLSSMTPGSSSRATGKVLDRFVRELFGNGTLNTRTLIRFLLKSSLQYDLNTLLAVAFDEDNSTIHIEVNKEPDALRDALYKTDLYVAYVQYVSASLGIPELRKDLADEIYEIETILYNVVNRSTAGEVVVMGNISIVSRYLPFPTLMVVEELNEILSGHLSRNTTLQVVLKGVDQLQKLGSFFKSMLDEPTFRTFLIWKIAQKVGPLTTYSILLSTIKLLHGKGMVAFDPHIAQSTCISETMNLMPMAYSIFVQKHLTASRDMKNLVQTVLAVRRSVVERVRRSIKWMSPTSREVALAKLHDMIFFTPAQLNETDMLHHDPVVPDLSVSSPFIEVYLIIKFAQQQIRFKNYGRPYEYTNQALPSVRYHPDTNQVVISAAALRPPYFDMDVPPSLVYSGLGHEIAHEILHAIDSVGKNIDDRGMRRVWWNEETQEKYSKQISCFASGNNDSREAEEIALDASALYTVFGLYKNAGADFHMQLSGLERFSGSQLFFINFCYKRCGMGKESCNNVVRHVAPFQRVFKCSQRSVLSSNEACMLV